MDIVIDVGRLRLALGAIARSLDSEKTGRDMAATMIDTNVTLKQAVWESLIELSNLPDEPLYIEHDDEIV